MSSPTGDLFKRAKSMDQNAQTNRKTLVSQPKYTPPQAGFVSLLPASWVPYAELMRLDRPAGFYAFYWHCAIGVAFAASISDPAPTWQFTVSMALYFVPAVLIFRGVACTWNDNIDQDFDRQVARCCNRPIARGAVSTTNGHIFTVAQFIIGVALLTALPSECMSHAVFMVTVLGIYPFAKRFSDSPQVILGFGLAHLIFLCCAAFRIDPFSTEVIVPASCLYAACVLWTIIFDTVYAHQDINDDKKAGVRSLAVSLTGVAKPVLSILASFQVALLVATGLWSGFSIVYYIGSCVGTALTLGSMLLYVDLERPESCAWWFGPGSKLVGGSIVAGLGGEYMTRILGIVDG